MDLRYGVAATTGLIDQAAAALDWQSAFDLVGRGLVDLDGFEAAVAELGTFGAVTSSVKTTATARVTSIEAALAGRGSLTEAALAVDTLFEEVNELAEIKRVGALLDAADPADLDDVSRQVGMI